MKKILTRSLTVIMALTMIFAFCACGCQDKEHSEKADNTEPVIYTNEAGQTQQELNAEEESFYGKWVATSAHAEYLYGNLELTINEDGTFDANVTEIPFQGTWEKTEDGISFDSEYITGKMYFGKKCKMVIYEDDIAPITLEKQE